jgi:hypothetical protein
VLQKLGARCEVVRWVFRKSTYTHSGELTSAEADRQTARPVVDKKAEFLDKLAAQVYLITTIWVGLRINKMNDGACGRSI